MSTRVSDTTIHDIAAFLHSRKYHNQRTVLFLGSRVSRFWRNTDLYSNIGGFSSNSFYGQSDGEKFKACYEVLSNGERFNARDVHQLLVNALSHRKPREEDACLAELIKEIFFDVVLSTCIDGVVEDACEQAGMEEDQDFSILNPIGEEPLDTIPPDPGRPMLVRVFGDLESRWYTTAGNELNLQEHGVLREYLKAILARDVLMVGYDPVWDKPIEHMFSAEGGHIYYVNEQAIPPEAPLMQAFRRRNGRYCIDSYGSYKSFVKALHRCILTLHYAAPSSSVASYTESPVEPSVEEKERTKVFISYSHQDTNYLKELLSHLKVYEQDASIESWCDRDIPVGADWRKEIDEALDRAKKAVLLVSQHFQSSRFISEVELPQLLEVARSRGLVIIPVLVRPCVIKDTPFSQFQIFNPDKPLSGLRPAKRDEMWAKVVGRIRKA
jgi:hypothetical protein